MQALSSQLFNSKPYTISFNKYLEYLSLCVNAVALSCFALLLTSSTPIAIGCAFALTLNFSLTLTKLALSINNLKNRLNQLNSLYEKTTGSKFDTLNQQQPEFTPFINISITYIALVILALSPLAYTLKIAGTITAMSCFGVGLTQLALKVNKALDHLKSLSFNTTALTYNDLESLVGVTKKTQEYLAERFAKNCDRISVAVLKETWDEGIPKEFQHLFKKALTERIVEYYCGKNPFNLSPEGLREETDLHNIMEGDFLASEQKLALKTHILNSITTETNPNQLIVLIIWLDKNFTIFKKTDTIPNLFHQTLQAYYDAQLQTEGALEIEEIEQLVNYNILSPSFGVLVTIYDNCSDEDRKQALIDHFDKNLDPSWQIPLTCFIFYTRQQQYDQLSVEELKLGSWLNAIRIDRQQMFKKSALDRLITYYCKSSLFDLPQTGLRSKNDLKHILVEEFLSKDQKTALKKHYLRQLNLSVDPEQAFEFLFWLDPHFTTFKISDPCSTSSGLRLDSYAKTCLLKNQLKLETIKNLIEKNLLPPIPDALIPYYDKAKSGELDLDALKTLNDSVWNTTINQILADQFVSLHEKTPLRTLQTTQPWMEEREDRQQLFKQSLLDQIVSSYTIKGLLNLEEYEEAELEAVISSTVLSDEQKQKLKESYLAEITDIMDPNNIFELILFMDPDFEYFTCTDLIPNLSLNLASYAHQSIPNLSDEFLGELVGKRVFRTDDPTLKQRYDQIIINSAGPIYLDNNADIAVVEVLISDMKVYASAPILNLFTEYSARIKQTPDQQKPLIIEFQQKCQAALLLP